MARRLTPVHPGEILREEFMVPLGLSMNNMAMDLRVAVTRIADIANERRGISADTALRFARYFKNSPTFLDEPPDPLRSRSCRRRDCRKGGARCSTLGSRVRAIGFVLRDPHQIKGLRAMFCQWCAQHEV